MINVYSVTHVLIHKGFIISSRFQVLSNFTMCQQKTKDLTSRWSWVGRWLREYRLDRCQSTWKRHPWWAYEIDTARSPFFSYFVYSESAISKFDGSSIYFSRRPSTPPPVIESIRWLYCADWWGGRVLLKISGSMNSTAVTDLSLNRKLCHLWWGENL